MTRSPRPRAVRIAVDLLGGDAAPAAVVDGALLARDADPELYLHLVGPPAVVDEVLGPRDRARVVTIPTEGATVRAGVAAVADGRVDALVSAGPSGATITAAVLGLGRIPGVRRPALAALVPARSGPLVLLDVGACPDNSVALLLQHATLGAAYARRMLNLADPRVGLLTIGTEAGKGDRARRVADGALRTGGLHYVGNVEGHDVPLGGPADVVVTDGFTGNVLLKGIEGAYALAGGRLSAGEASRAAVLLGVRGTVVVCHGAAGGADIASGIALAARLHRTPAPDLLDLLEVTP